MAFPWVKLPFIFGTDVAGEVVEAGHGITRFKIGDRVVGIAQGINQKHNNSSMSAFQEYTVLLPNATSPIPDTLSYERAAVLPLGLSTAAAGLFQADQLAIQLPSAPPKPPTKKTLLIWGGLNICW
jgi:NADPH:quinone reductase-like Zn-dependent oxidoreductase